jgi:BASS family bile acid:Na+ symporter
MKIRLFIKKKPSEILNKENIAFGVGLMVLLMVVTIIYLPLVLPLLLPGVAVNPMKIAGSLIVLMLIPLAIGLFILMHIAGEIGKRSQAT